MDPSQLEKGESLLESIFLRSKPFSEEEVRAITAFLDQKPPEQLLIPGTETPFKSKDLNIGVPRKPPITEEENISMMPQNTNAEHFDERVQEDAFTFIKSDVRIELSLRHPRPWVQVQSVRRTFYHHQLYGAFWLLLAERGVRRGSIVADLMGLGKTTTAFLYVLFNYWLAENAEHVRKNERLHCRPSSGSYRQPPEVRCPSAYMWPITCSCQEWSPTVRLGLTARTGATLVLLPTSLLGRWAAEWEALGVDESSAPRMFINHATYKHRALGLATARPLKLAGAPAHQVGSHRMTDPVAPGAHRLLVLTTVDSYFTWVQKRYGSRWQWKEVRIGAKPRDQDFTDGLAWARIIRDESHLQTNWETHTFQIIQSLAHNGWNMPNLQMLTATPMLRNGVGDVMSTLKAINLVSPDIMTDRECKKFSNDAFLDGLSDRFLDFRKRQLRGTVLADSDEEASLVTEIGELLSSYSIRRRSETIQNGKKLADIPPLTCLDVACSADQPENTTAMQEFEGMLKGRLSRGLEELQTQHIDSGGRLNELEVAQEMLLENVKLGRVIATAPALTRYHRQSRVLLWDSIKAKRWHKRPETSIFYKDFGQILEDSGKLQTLRTILLELGVDVTGEPEKLVVVSEFPVVCLLVLCLCMSLQIGCEWMHSDLDAPEREELVSMFQGTRETSSEVAQGRPFRVLVGTSWVMGQGLTLNKAFRLVLTEPGKHDAVEAQIADRVHRIGSQTDVCWFMRLINASSALEKAFVTDQGDQARLQQLIEWYHTTDERSRGESFDSLQSVECELGDQQAELAELVIDESWKFAA